MELGWNADHPRRASDGESTLGPDESVIGGAIRTSRRDGRRAPGTNPLCVKGAL